METYHQRIEWLFSQVPVFQNEGASAYKPGLEKMVAFATYLGTPQKNLAIIHVGGTNGKGSTSHMIAAALQTKGAKVGLFTSPHLFDFTERIRVNGHPVSKHFVSTFIEEHKAYFVRHQLSFFEITFGMSLVHFAKEKVDYAIIEVGLGGRLDATNIVSPILSIITNIGLDHTQFLGDTHAQIAFEKAGIIKPSVPIIIGEKDPRTAEVFSSVAQKNNAPLIFAADFPKRKLKTDLLGRYQLKNIHTASVALKFLFPQEEVLPYMKSSFERVVSLTGLRGRWELLGQNPTVIADVTHNKEGFVEVVEQLNRMKKNRMHFVLGFVKDKPLDDIFNLLPKEGIFYICAPSIARAIKPEKVASVAAKYELNTQTFTSVKEAIRSAKKNAHKDDFVYIGGSTFVIAEALNKE